MTETVAKMLAVHSNGDGPRTAVSRLRKIEVRGASKDDVIKVEFSGQNLNYVPDPLVLRGSLSRTVNYPRGFVQVKRLAGKSPITVLAFCERSTNVVNATE